MSIYSNCDQFRPRDENGVVCTVGYVIITIDCEFDAEDWAFLHRKAPQDLQSLQDLASLSPQSLQPSPDGIHEVILGIKEILGDLKS